MSSFAAHHEEGSCMPISPRRRRSRQHLRGGVCRLSQVFVETLPFPDPIPEQVMRVNGGLRCTSLEHFESGFAVGIVNFRAVIPVKSFHTPFLSEPVPT